MKRGGMRVTAPPQTKGETNVSEVQDASEEE